MPEMQSDVFAQGEVMPHVLYRAAWLVERGYVGLTDEQIEWWEEMRRRRAEEEASWTTYFWKRLFPEAFPKPLPGFKDKEDVRSKSEAVNVLNHYGIAFRKVADNLMFRCPFHSDERPSASFSVKKKLWYCHPCAAGGDIFNFVMRMEGISFQDAIGELDFWG